MKITIRHQLSLPVDSGSARAVQHLLLTPLNGSTQNVANWTIDMPGIEAAARFTDAFGNRAHLVSQAKPEADLVVTVTGTVETFDRNGVLGRPAGGGACDRLGRGPGAGLGPRAGGAGHRR